MITVYESLANGTLTDGVLRSLSSSRFVTTIKTAWISTVKIRRVVIIASEWGG